MNASLNNVTDITNNYFLRETSMGHIGLYWNSSTFDVSINALNKLDAYRKSATVLETSLGSVAGPDNVWYIYPDSSTEFTIGNFSGVGYNPIVFIKGYNPLERISNLTNSKTRDLGATYDTYVDASFYSRNQVDASFALKSSFTGTFLSDGSTVSVSNGIITSVV